MTGHNLHQKHHPEDYWRHAFPEMMQLNHSIFIGYRSTGAGGIRNSQTSLITAKAEERD